MEINRKTWRIPLLVQSRFNIPVIPDRLYLKCMYMEMMGKKPDLKDPVTFNEKLQWLKLHDRKQIYIKMVDKIEAKRFAADIIGEEYIIPTMGVWERPEEIDFEALPDRFVMKCSHDSGGVLICKDKGSFDTDNARAVIGKRLKHNYYLNGREWPYKHVRPRIIAEPLIDIWKMTTDMAD